MEQYLTIREAAERYGVDHQRLRRAAYDGRLLIVKRDNHQLVRPDEVERFLREGGKAPTITLAPRREGAAAARVIAVAIPKGGTGKTTTTLNLGVALAEQGQRVLLIDTDPQGSLTHAMGFDLNKQEWTLANALELYIKDYKSELARAIIPTTEGVDLVPGSEFLNRSQADLSHLMAPAIVFKKLITPLRQSYDYILIDTMPYLGVLVQNALVAADEVLIPLEAASLSTNSARMMFDEVEAVRAYELNTNLRILGFLLTRLNPGTTIARDFVAYVRRTFGERAPVFETVIEHRTSVMESQAGVEPGSLFKYAPTDPATQAYRALAQEVLGATS